MRLSEGLWYINNNKELLYTEVLGSPIKNSNGVYMDNDIVYAYVTGDAKKYAEPSVTVDEIELVPIVKYYKLSRETIQNSEQKIIFD